MNDSALSPQKIRKSFSSIRKLQFELAKFVFASFQKYVQVASVRGEMLWLLNLVFDLAETYTKFDCFIDSSDGKYV